MRQLEDLVAVDWIFWSGCVRILSTASRTEHMHGSRGRAWQPRPGLVNLDRARCLTARHDHVVKHGPGRQSS
jgi:hypothetical protein